MKPVENPTAWAEIIDASAWPLAAVLIVVATVIVLKRPIAAVLHAVARKLQDLSRVSTTSLDFDSQQEQDMSNSPKVETIEDISRQVEEPTGQIAVQGSPTGVRHEEPERLLDSEKIHPYIREVALKNLSELDALMPSDSQRREDLLLVRYSQSTTRLYFDNRYKLIYGSQIEALRHLQQSGPDELKYFYNEHLIRRRLSGGVASTVDSETLKAAYPYDDWLAFIENSGFVEDGNGLPKLTPMGELFLQFMKESNLPKNKY